MSKTEDVLNELTSLHALGDEPEEAPAPPAPLAAAEPESEPEPEIEGLTDAAMKLRFDRMLGVLDGIASGFADLRALVAELRGAFTGSTEDPEVEVGIEVEAELSAPRTPRDVVPARRAVKAALPPDPPEVNRQMPPLSTARRPMSSIERQVAERRAKAYSAAAPGSLPIPDLGPEVLIDSTASQVSDEDRADVAALTGMRRPVASPDEAVSEAQIAAQRRLAAVEGDFSDYTLDDDDARPRGREQGATNGSVPTS